MNDREGTIQLILEELSALMQTEDGARALVLLQHLRALHSSDPATPEPALPHNENIKVGIWTGQQGEKTLQRSATFSEEWHLWADTAHIPLAIPLTGEKKRIVLLGESVARGYFYDPVITPAQILNQQLHAFGPAGYEVIDLARTNQKFHELMNTLLESLALKPDGLLIFAGNNWMNLNYSRENWIRMAKAYRDGGISSLKKYFEEEMLGQACYKFIQFIASIKKEHGIPVFLIIPGFNDAHWYCEPKLLAPILSDKNEQNQWMEAFFQANKALAANHHAAAAKWASTLFELDRGTSSRSLQLLIESSPDAEPATIATLRRLKRDAPCGTFQPHSPRMHRSVSEFLKIVGADIFDFMLDVDALFREQEKRKTETKSETPTRYLDYCHLTVEALHEVLKPVAMEIHKALSDPKTGPPPDQPMRLPTKKEDAIVWFLAAIHNAHYGQPEHIVRAHAQKAIKKWPPIVSFMKNYLEAQEQPGPLWTSTGYQKLCSEPAVHRYLHYTDRRKTRKLADTLLKKVFRSHTKDKKRFSKHTPLPSFNLLETQHFAQTYREAVGYNMGLPRRAYQEFTLGSSFYFDALAKQYSFVLTCRMPTVPEGGSGTCYIYINNNKIGSWEVGNRWKTITFTTTHSPPEEQHLSISWKTDHFGMPGSPKQISLQLEQQIIPDMLPVFAEIQHFQCNPILTH